MGGYRRHNTILLTLIGIWFCLITFGNSEGSNLIRQLKGRSKLKKAKSTIFSSSLKGKDNAYFKAMLKKKQATLHPTTEVLLYYIRQYDYYTFFIGIAFICS